MKAVAILLLLFEPLHFAIEALRVLSTLSYRGATAGVELIVHGGVAALCAAAALALLNAVPSARAVATAAVIASILRTIQSLYWSALPNNTPPGDEPLIVGTAVALGGLVLLVVQRTLRSA